VAATPPPPKRSRSRCHQRRRLTPGPRVHSQITSTATTIEEVPLALTPARRLAYTRRKSARSTKLTASLCGKASLGTLYGWIFCAHMIGAAMAAYPGGVFLYVLGDYHLMFISAAPLGFVAVILSLGIRLRPTPNLPSPPRPRPSPPRSARYASL
jgi:hypothetical protein